MHQHPEDHVESNPERAHISISYVERRNLTIADAGTSVYSADERLQVHNHYYALALHFTFYNFVRQHKALRCIPAMAAGLSKTL